MTAEFRARAQRWRKPTTRVEIGDLGGDLLPTTSPRRLPAPQFGRVTRPDPARRSQPAAGLAELDLPVVPYNGGEAPIDKDQFVKARAEDYWTLRERFEQGEIDIDPDDDKLAAQLGSIKWGIDSRRIKIESKDDMRKRRLPSPDRADAMAIAFAGRANAAPTNVESHAGESITGDLMTKVW